jgi:hypothetical protein
MSGGVISFAHAQQPWNGRRSQTTLSPAQAAVLRDAAVRAQFQQSLLRRQQEQQILAVRQQAALATAAQRARQLQELQAAARRQALQRTAEIQAAQHVAASRQAAQRNAELQALQTLAAGQAAVKRAVQIETLKTLAAGSHPSAADRNRQLLQLLGKAKPQAPLFSGNDSPEQLISKLNSLSSADVAKLTSKPNVLDQFTPNWVKNAPGGNVLAQFGIGNGLMKELGSTDPKRILDPNGLNAIQGKLRQAQILGNLAAGQAAENKVRNSVQANQNLLLADKDKAEALRRLYEQVSRTGLSP